MAEAESRSITRRALVAAPAAALAASLPGAAQVDVSIPSQTEITDPVYAAIVAHAEAYAACGAYQNAEPDDEVGLEPLLDVEIKTAEALAATVPTTLAGTAAALTYVHVLNAQAGHPPFDGWHCYVFIGSAATAMRRALDLHDLA